MVGSVYGSIIGLIIVVILAAVTAGGLAPLLAGVAKNLKTMALRIARAVEELPGKVRRVVTTVRLARSIRPSTVGSTLTSTVGKGKDAIRRAVQTARGAARPRKLNNPLPIKLHEKRNPGINGVYQRIAAGRDFEEVYELSNGKVVGIDNFSNGEVICAKFYGNKDGTWGKDNLSHPANTLYPKILQSFNEQVEKLLQFNDEVGGTGVVYRFGSEAARKHYLENVLLAHKNATVVNAVKQGIIRTETYLFTGPRRGPKR